MKINFPDHDLTNFLVREGVFCGLYTKLVQPNHIGTKFNQANKIFRSSIWLDNGELLSGSYPKFVNWGENPIEFPAPTDIKGWTLVEKIDGSACVVDYVNGMFSARTRGTFTYAVLDNRADFDLMFEKYPSIKEFVMDNPHYSLLFEIVTPNLRIVLNYGDIDLYLCGCVNKNDYSLLLQSELDTIAKTLGVKRPSYYTFSSVEDLLNEVEKWKGLEGVVAYSPDGQHLLKIKSDWYRKLHAAKENFRNIEAVIDVFFVFEKPIYNDFITKFTDSYDYETLLICQGFISTICDGWKEVEKIYNGFENFISKNISPMGDPKDKKCRGQMAPKVIAAYGNSGRTSMIFKLMDGKALDDQDYKKLLFQVLKK